MVKISPSKIFISHIFQCYLESLTLTNAYFPYFPPPFFISDFIYIYIYIYNIYNYIYIYIYKYIIYIYILNSFWWCEHTWCVIWAMFNHQFFKILQEKREQYSLRSNLVAYEKIDLYFVQWTGLVIWLTMYLASIH